jgi:hypothetical protein
VKKKSSAARRWEREHPVNDEDKTPVEHPNIRAGQHQGISYMADKGIPITDVMWLCERVAQLVRGRAWRGFVTLSLPPER